MDNKREDCGLSWPSFLLSPSSLLQFRGGALHNLSPHPYSPPHPPKKGFLSRWGSMSSTIPLCSSAQMQLVTNHICSNSHMETLNVDNVMCKRVSSRFVSSPLSKQVIVSCWLWETPLTSVVSRWQWITSCLLELDNWLPFIHYSGLNYSFGTVYLV